MTGRRGATAGRASVLGVAMAMASGVALSAVLAACAASPPPPPEAVMRESAPPWTAPRDAVSYIRAAGLPELPSSYEPAERFTVTLAVRVDGLPVAVPGNVGIDEVRSKHAPIHTHDTSGTVWVEPKEPALFTVGDFFTLWGVRLDERCLGSACPPDGVRVYVNGKPQPRDPREVPLEADTRITVIAE